MGSDENKRIMNPDHLASVETTLTTHNSDIQTIYGTTWKSYNTIDKISKKYKSEGLTVVGYDGGNGATFNFTGDFSGNLASRATSYSEGFQEVFDLYKEAKTFYPFADVTLQSKIQERTDELVELVSILSSYGDFVTSGKAESNAHANELSELRARNYSVGTIWESTMKNIEKHFEKQKNMTTEEIIAYLKKEYGDVMDENQIHLVAAFAEYKVKNIPVEEYHEGRKVTVLKSKEELMEGTEVALIRLEDGTYVFKEIKDVKGNIVYTVGKTKVSASVALLGLVNYNLATGKAEANAKVRVNRVNGQTESVLPGNKKSNISVGASFALLGIKFPEKTFNQDENINAFTSGEATFGKADATFRFGNSESAVDVRIGATAAELSGNIIDIHGEDYGFFVDGSLAVGSARIDAKISCNEVSLKVGAGIIGGGLSLGTYETIDKNLNF